MVSKRVFAVGLLLSAFLSASASAHSAHCKDTPLGEVMSRMKKDMKSYTRAFRRGDEETMQQKIDLLIELSIKAQDYVPMKVEEQKTASVGEDSLFNTAQEEYLLEMNKLNEMLVQLKTASSDTEIKSLLDQVNQHKKDSHKSFRKECD